MITRRKLLLGTAGVVAGSVLSGCNRSPDVASFDVTVLEGAIPSEVIKQFRKRVEASVQFHPVVQPQRVFQELQRWQRQPEKKARGSRFMPWQREKMVPSAHDLVSINDYWLRSAIAQKLIAPLTLSDVMLEPLPYGWQQFATRDDQGKMVSSGASSSTESSRELWAAPYKVQSLVIVYRQSQVQEILPAGVERPFQTWRDLLSPALQGRIALPDHPNLVIGLLQKMQTGSFNTSFDSLVNSSSPTAQLVTQLNEQLADPFAALNAQVKTYDADTALKALVNEDVQVVVAWSGDVVTALQRYRDLRAVIPAEGSLLSADMWVRPHDAPMGEAAHQWISFCWEEAAATQLSVSGRGLSPVFLTEDGLADPSTLPSAMAGVFEKAWLSPSALQKSEPLLPLPDAMQAAYFALWQQLRSGSV